MENYARVVENFIMIVEKSVENSDKWRKYVENYVENLLKCGKVENGCG